MRASNCPSNNQHQASACNLDQKLQTGAYLCMQMYFRKPFKKIQFSMCVLSSLAHYRIGKGTLCGCSPLWKVNISLRKSGFQWCAIQNQIRIIHTGGNCTYTSWLKREFLCFTQCLSLWEDKHMKSKIYEKKYFCQNVCPSFTSR